MSAIITVIIPVYNGEKYVRRAVESVVNQPRKCAAEVLLVNDGSTDRSGTICDNLAEEFDNVRVIHKENGGVSSARNLGIASADTKYIAFLDCDDWWMPDFLDTDMVAEFEKENSADVYHFAYQEISNDEKLVRVYPVVEQKFTFSEPGLGRYDWSHPCSFVYRHKLIVENNVLFPSVKLGEDGPFVNMALFHANIYIYISKTIFTYFENFSSCMHNKSVLTDYAERGKAMSQEAQYLAKYGVSTDLDDGFSWRAAEILPRVCAENSYAVTLDFMERNCLAILRRRPDIHFGEEKMHRIEAWKSHPRRCYLRYRVTQGIPLRIKQIGMSIPFFAPMVSYAYNRFYRKMVPYQSK